MAIMFRKLGTFLVVVALVFASMGIAANASACPMKQGGDMQMMDCDNDCPNCVSQNDDGDSNSNCCDDGFARCGMSSVSAFYAPAGQSITFNITSVTFAFDNEQAKSASLTPDKQPPKFLS